MLNMNYEMFKLWTLIYFRTGDSYAVNTKRKAKRDRSTKKNPSEKYFRAEKHSTSTLLSTDIEPEDAVYAIIPVRDQDLRVADIRGQKPAKGSKHDVASASIDRKEHRIISVSRRISLNGQPVIEQPVENEINQVDIENGYRLPLDCRVTSIRNTGAGSENLYHCLRDVRKQISQSTKNKVCNGQTNNTKCGSSLREATRRFSEDSPRPSRHACVVENEYDTLSYSPRTSVPDGTYNHVPMTKKKDRKTSLN